MLLNSFFHIVNEENPNTVVETEHGVLLQHVTTSQQNVIHNTYLKDSVETCHGASLQYIIRLNPEHPIFKGHFPGNPITPGVCVVQIAIDLFSHLFQQEYHLHKAKSIKFLNLIKPNEINTICYKLSWEKLENDEYRLKALVTQDDITYAKIDITVETEN